MMIARMAGGQNRDRGSEQTKRTQTAKKRAHKGEDQRSGENPAHIQSLKGERVRVKAKGLTIIK